MNNLRFGNIVLFAWLGAFVFGVAFWYAFFKFVMWVISQ